ncbi:MAG: acylglycerol kinase family protein [Candidatus Nanopelagicales bacterium]|nr:acylglycerol kinase family protein [Candidatus Nanopelagicales bacterium]
MNATSRPSSRRRALAILALVALLVGVVLVILLLLRQPTLLIGGIVGLALAGAGGWWLATEQNPRRTIGVAVMVLGVVVIGWAVLRAFSNSAGGWWRLVVVVGILAVAVGAARAALVRDLHDIDAMRAGRVRPKHPVLICNPKSGGGKVEKFGLIQMADEMGVEVVLLEKGLDLAQLARDAIARGADCLGMAGGDGSQALVASIAIEHDIPFVCISAGTRNHFALDLGFDREDPRKGMVALRDGVPRRVDYATVGDRLFVNNVSVTGFSSTTFPWACTRRSFRRTITAMPRRRPPRASSRNCWAVRRNPSTCSSPIRMAARSTAPSW